MQINRQQVKGTIATRAGVVVLELILTLPAFLIIMLAVVQISLIYVAIEQTAYASRYAAKIASETSAASINTINTGSLKSTIDSVLRVGGLPQGSCRVILEHNVDNGGVELTIADPDPAAMNCNCDPPATVLPQVPGSSVDESVRTTVCVRLGDNIPDFLSTFGFSVADFVVEESTTYLYEL
ncbi:TadE/TadG family type IV pilus assembly protein [Gimesia sp.]|uniref:TadE/TadG family type IV pilus assembly protein n=1 Tax=Gimesia sp. TaxID=2024833 RepID=UPI003A92E4B8